MHISVFAPKSFNDLDVILDVFKTFPKGHIVFFTNTTKMSKLLRATLMKRKHPDFLIKEAKPGDSAYLYEKEVRLSDKVYVVDCESSTELTAKIKATADAFNRPCRILSHGTPTHTVVT